MTTRRRIHDPSWAQLHRYGENRLLRTAPVWFIVVPIVVKLFRIEIGDLHLGALMALPFSWQVFYYSACCFAIASIVYAVRCPHMVRDYSSFSAFVQEGRGATQLADYLLDVLPPNRSAIPLARKFFTYTEDPRSVWQVYVDEGNRDQITRALAVAVIPADRLRDAFWFVWKLANQSRSFARRTCVFFYLAGGMLMTVVVVQNFLSVLRYTLTGAP